MSIPPFSASPNASNQSLTLGHEVKDLPPYLYIALTISPTLRSPLSTYTLLSVLICNAADANGTPSKAKSPVLRLIVYFLELL